MSFLLEVSIVSATYCHHCHKCIKQQVFYNLLFLLNLLMKINPKQELCVTGPNVTMLCLKMLFTEQNESSVLAQRLGGGGAGTCCRVASHEQRLLAGAAPPGGARAALPEPLAAGISMCVWFSVSCWTEPARTAPESTQTRSGP